MYKLEQEVRSYLDTLSVTKPETKDDVRDILLERKLDNLVSERVFLKKHEARAIALMKKVDYRNIEPRIVNVAPRDKPLWNWYRHILSSAPWTGRPGRANFFFVVDERTSGILGIVDIGSDLQALGPRDRHIGWTHERKFSGGLNHLANVGTCVCVAPFGILTGGKFQIVASTSRFVSDLWKMRYGDALAGVTTTSLYGKSSVYNRIKEFEYLGDTPGMGVFHLTSVGVGLLKAFMNANNISARTGGKAGNFINKSDLLSKACNVIGYDQNKISSHQPRGVYFAKLGDDAIDFLNGGSSTFDQYKRSQDDVSKWWLDRWYSMRYPKVANEIKSFDFGTYTVDRQIKTIRERLHAGEAK